eukprot:6757030-Pyramimonas_sp.AAC.1
MEGRWDEHSGGKSKWRAVERASGGRRLEGRWEEQVESRPQRADSGPSACAHGRRPKAAPP